MSTRPLGWVLLLLVALPAAQAGEPGTAGPGQLRIVTNYWADVYVDGKRKGRAPTPPISLPAGKHVVELRGNPRVKDYRIEVVIKAGERLEVVAESTPVN
ncbi:PEGA domain-containing protein [Archangium gephyra]|uniref:PEGA domain-containing protein n=1 Tax=Archangium gephyra TaxID=48 RepID=A0AAC8QGE5_9BACT|nr:PEGA domain-containing protein [Archangium gephyra]AKJ07013.1 Hypothetical protein AA314_08639 [Archangium gephyra]REG31701.1 PEGA domain-containing protein [Archangium gephyra]